jgi:hypothetical protein
MKNKRKEKRTALKFTEKEQRIIKSLAVIAAVTGILKLFDK